MSNHVDARPSVVRNVSASTRLEPMRTAAIRPDGVRSTVRSPAATWSRLATRPASRTIGPQAWCGEPASYGSVTDRRYGTSPSLGQTSWTFAVRPPDVEKKYVV